jgi:hypothetical protein
MYKDIPNNLSRRGRELREILMIMMSNNALGRQYWTTAAERSNRNTACTL